MFYKGRGDGVEVDVRQNPLINCIAIVKHNLLDYFQLAVEVYLQN